MTKSVFDVVRHCYCRTDLFYFPHLQDIRRYIKHFQEDSRVGIDVAALGSLLPSKIRG